MQVNDGCFVPFFAEYVHETHLGKLPQSLCNETVRSNYIAPTSAQGLDRTTRNQAAPFFTIFPSKIARQCLGNESMRKLQAQLTNHAKKKGRTFISEVKCKTHCKTIHTCMFRLEPSSSGFPKQTAAENKSINL